MEPPHFFLGVTYFKELLGFPKGSIIFVPTGPVRVGSCWFRDVSVELSISVFPNPKGGWSREIPMSAWRISFPFSAERPTGAAFLLANCSQSWWSYISPLRIGLWEPFQTAYINGSKAWKWVTNHLYTSPGSPSSKRTLRPTFFGFPSRQALRGESTRQVGWWEWWRGDAPNGWFQHRNFGVFELHPEFFGLFRPRTEFLQESQGILSIIRNPPFFLQISDERKASLKLTKSHFQGNGR